MNQRSTKIVQLLSREKDEITVAGFAEYFEVEPTLVRILRGALCSIGT